MNRWEHFDHDADIGIRGLGATKAQGFEQAALALTAVMSDPDLVRPAEKIIVQCDIGVDDDELLLNAFLNAVIYEIDTRNMMFSRCAVILRPGALTAELWGEPIDVERHHPAVMVKGATMTELAVKQNADGRWVAQCVVDV